MRTTNQKLADKFLASETARYARKSKRLLNAAAPDLLVALKILHKALWDAGLKLNVRKHFSLMAAAAQASTAISKAEGE